MLMAIRVSPRHRWGLRDSPVVQEYNTLFHSIPVFQSCNNYFLQHSQHFVLCVTLSENCTCICVCTIDIDCVAFGVIGPTWDSACVLLCQASLASPDKMWRCGWWSWWWSWWKPNQQLEEEGGKYRMDWPQLLKMAMRRRWRRIKNTKSSDPRPL